MKIIIAGFGYVGKAVHSVFTKKHNVVIVDPQVNNDTVKNHLNADGVIICVPTPLEQDGHYSLEAIKNVLDTVPEKMPVLIKSTIRPDDVDILSNLYPNLKITYNPEFLRANTAMEDYVHQSYTIIGGYDPDKFWQKLLLVTLPNCSAVHTCSAKESAIIKQTTNAFLSLKNSFFNQIYDICSQSNTNFNLIRDLLILDRRIGKEHTVVPGYDNQRGFGGHCLPKDTSAFLSYSKSVKAPLTVLETAISYNKTIRNIT